MAYDNVGIGTNEGIRFKSARTRGGYVRDVLIRGLKLTNVPLPFTFTLNWNPSYSYATIPKGVDHIPPHWVVLTTPVTPLERGLCEISNITIEDVEITGALSVFSATGLPEKLIRNVSWKNINAQAVVAGTIEICRRLDHDMTNVKLQTSEGLPVKTAHNTNVQMPEVVKQPARN